MAETRQGKIDRILKIQKILQAQGGVDGGVTMTPYTEPQSFDELRARPDERSAQAQSPNLPPPSLREQYQRGISAPFSQMAQGTHPRAQAAAQILDVPFNVFGGMAEGGAKIGEALGLGGIGFDRTPAPTPQTAFAETVTGLTQAALPAIFPVPSLAFAGLMKGLPPSAQAAVQKASTPITSISQPTTREQRASTELGDVALQALGFGGTKIAPPIIGKGLRSTGQKIMGTALRAGENLERAKALSKFAVERGITMTEGGSKALSQAETVLKSELYGKILEPLTDNLVTLDPQTALTSLTELNAKISDGLLTGGKDFGRVVQKSINELTEKISKEPGGKLTPEKAQHYKETANFVLDKFYEKKGREGKPPLDTARMETIGASNNALRRALEELHPEIKGINWERGAGLEVKQAIDGYLLQKYKGGGEKSELSAAFRLRPSKMTSFSVYDLLGSRAFRSKMAVLLDKTGRRLTGEEPNIVSGVKNPVKKTPTFDLTEEQIGQRQRVQRERADFNVRENPNYITVKPVADRAGVRIEEFARGFGGEMRIRFTDMKTMHTESLPVKDFTVENIARLIASKK